jgi:hypothetical protein
LFQHRSKRAVSPNWILASRVTSYLPITGASRRLVVAVALILWSGCTLQQPLQRRVIGEVGYFEFHNSVSAVERAVVGVSRGATEAAAIEYASAIRNHLNAGLVIAHAFNEKIPVSQPLIHTSPIARPGTIDIGLRSLYPEFQKLLRSTIDGPIEFYVGLRSSDNSSVIQSIEVASAGITFEQLKVMKNLYAQIRDGQITSPDLPIVEIALNPLDDISWNSDGVKNHGVLMLARRGLILRLPSALAEARVRAVYQNILAAWVSSVKSISLDNRLPSQVSDVTSMPLGRIDSVAARTGRHGIVIGAPHGSFDWYTGELVEALSYRTALPAVIARGFTPTECGGWRINVNRPTERRYPTDTIERTTERAAEVYRRYSDAVLKSASGPLGLYIEIHQNGDVDDIDVATVGFTWQQAQAIKIAYGHIRDRVLRDFPGVVIANLMIEPFDQVAIGAWAAKDHGLLKLAKRSLHFEMPSHRVFYGSTARRAYRKILAELIQEILTSHSLDS